MNRSQHVRTHLIALGERGMASLLYLTRAGLIVQDIKNCQRQMIEEEEYPISVDIALKYLRKVHDYTSLLDYYNKKQQVGVGRFSHVVKRTANDSGKVFKGNREGNAFVAAQLD